MGIFFYDAVNDNNNSKDNSSCGLSGLDRP